MTNALLKRAILRSLQNEPDFSGLSSLPSLASRRGRIFLRWLDQSGLALPFLAQLQQLEALNQLAQEWRLALSARLTRNAERARDMLEEVQRIRAAFRSFGVTAVSLKGFTLTPDFCEHPYFRHQVDFDFLVERKSVRAAAEALCSCGYSYTHLNESGETCFLTPLKHIPSASDDLYGLQRQRQADLHTWIWEPCSWWPLQVPQDCLEKAQHQYILGADFLSLSLEDKFLLQVLHAFHHSFRSWVRASWFFEIAKCLEKHQDNVTLWNGVTKRAGSTKLMKSVFSFVLGLAERLFHCPIPSSLHSWKKESTTLSLTAWLDHFSLDWAISDWPGSLNNLFLAAEFIPDPDLRMQYLRSRLLPKKKSTSLGSLTPTSPAQFFRLQAARLGYVARRTAAHLKDIVALPLEQFRWKRALHSSRRLGFDGNC
jgi:hypothetical protein